MRSGFTIIKNGELLDFPYKESLQSLAPLVDEIVVAHGDSEDSTLEELHNLAKKLPTPLKIISSPWDASNLNAGAEIARQTNIVLEHCSHDVCFYLQADEVLHQDEYSRLSRDLDFFEKDENLQGLALRWVHFYGNFDWRIESPDWCRHELRVIKKNASMRSYGDAGGFRILGPQKDWTKCRAALSQASIFHYAWVRKAEIMKKKLAASKKPNSAAKNMSLSSEEIFPVIFGMKAFEGSHPVYMKERIKRLSKDLHQFNTDEIKKTKSFFLKIRRLIENSTGWRPGESTHYKSLKKY